MRQHGITQPVLDYLMWHHFGSSPEERAHDLINVFRHYFNNDLQASNLAKLTEQYIWRPAIDLEREHNMDLKGDTKTLKVKGGHQIVSQMLQMSQKTHWSHNLISFNQVSNF